MKWTLFGNHYSTGNISSPGAQSSRKTDGSDHSVPITQYQSHRLKLINSSSAPSFYHFIPIEHDGLRTSYKTFKSMASHVDCVILQDVTMHAAGGKNPGLVSHQCSFAEQGCTFTHNALLWIHSLVMFVPLSCIICMFQCNINVSLDRLPQRTTTLLMCCHAFCAFPFVLSLCGSEATFQL